MSGQSVVTIAGRDFYLGPDDYPELTARRCASDGLRCCRTRMMVTFQAGCWLLRVKIIAGRHRDRTACDGKSLNCERTHLGKPNRIDAYTDGRGLARRIDRIHPRGAWRHLRCDR